MTRPDDALYRFRVGAFALLRVTIPVVVLFALLVVPIALFGTSWAVGLGWLLFFLGLFALWTTKGMPLYPAHTFGVEHRVDEDTFDGPRKYCAGCGTTTKQGLRRRYARQAVFMGVPVHTLEWGVNDYSLDCAEPGGGPAVEPGSAIGRVQRNDESAERELERAFE